mmetsp:Transcript_5263/g.16918  ORF Transcript_5263/g.16918 Transcript_5263/m.16918 type:complete len:264 (+) Transcript_5263:256-1047(+)
MAVAMKVPRHLSPSPPAIPLAASPSFAPCKLAQNSASAASRAPALDPSGPPLSCTCLGCPADYSSRPSLPRTYSRVAVLLAPTPPRPPTSYARSFVAPENLGRQTMPLCTPSFPLSRRCSSTLALTPLSTRVRPVPTARPPPKLGRRSAFPSATLTACFPIGLCVRLRPTREPIPSTEVPSPAKSGPSSCATSVRPNPSPPTRSLLGLPFGYSRGRCTSCSPARVHDPSALPARSTSVPSRACCPARLRLTCRSSATPSVPVR